MIPEIILPQGRDLSISPTSSRLVMETVKGSYKFVIQGYSLAKGIGIGNHIASDTFTVGGYQWVILFYPDGESPEDNSTYVSVFIALESESESEGRYVRALFELTLVDQSGKGKHMVYSHFTDPGGPITLKNRGSGWGFPRYFTRAALETSDYLKDDRLKMNCTVGVVVPVMDSPRYSIQVPESDLAVHIGLLLEKKENSDVIFDVAGEKIHAHKLILAVRSPIFRTMFLDGPDEAPSEIVITDLEPKVFKAMLHFIYKDTLDEDDVPVGSGSPGISVPETFPAKLLAAADKYRLRRLRLMCESYLCEYISVNSVASILELADRFHAMELKDACLRFAAENLSGTAESSSSS